MNNSYDAIVIGAGPNGLAASICLAQAQLSVLLIEAKPSIGGGMRSAALTLPGFTHDICSAIHPLGAGSPFFNTLPLSQYGLEWIQPQSPLAHPLDDGSACLLERSVEETAFALGVDEQPYLKLMKPFVEDWNILANDILGPLHLPVHPMKLARFGYYAIRSAEGLAQKYFSEKKAQALFAGLAAHSIMSLKKPITASFGLVLGILGHAIGWPLPKGGSQNIANALGDYFRSLRGEITTDWQVKDLAELPKSRTILLDVTPRQLLQITGDRLPASYQKKLLKYRYGAGVFKVDWALDRPIPWIAEECLRAGTVHLGNTLQEIVLAEQAVDEGKIPSKPFVLLAQQSLFDPSRAPPNKHTAWAYCHVPNGSEVDMTQAIEQQVERFAPGFRDCILARHTFSTSQLEGYNANYIGGDINGGVQDILQLFTRPTFSLTPYRTPLKGVYLCSSSTPPGGGVHGMCGYHAAQVVLKDLHLPFTK